MPIKDLQELLETLRAHGVTRYANRELTLELALKPQVYPEPAQGEAPSSEEDDMFWSAE